MHDFIEAEVIGQPRRVAFAGRGRMPQRRPVMAGALHGNVVSDYLSAALQDPSQQDALSEVLSQSAQKFVVSPEGQSLVNKATWEVAIPAFVLGMAAYWLLTRGRS